MSIYPYDSRDELVEALSKLIRLKHLEDVQPGEDIVQHGSRWWEVGDVLDSGERLKVMLEIAGPSSVKVSLETCEIFGAASDLTVVTERSLGLQFSDGTLLETPWPEFDLIYVKDARRRLRALRGPEENVFGIFARRWDNDGGSYYCPVDPEFQPGVASDWVLDPRFDVILDWKPVEVCDLLSRLQGEEHD